MGVLDTYNCLAAKRSNFSCIRIDTKQQFDELFHGSYFSDSIWRGMPVAKHKLYTSLQRFWITNDLSVSGESVFDYLEDNIARAMCWRGESIAKYYNSLMGREPGVLAILSLLRHYGVPSPLSDWTRNSNVALYFAIEGESDSRDLEIDNYFSVYELKRDHSWFSNRLKSNIVSLVEGLLSAEKDVKDGDGYKVLVESEQNYLLSAEVTIEEKAHRMVNNLNYFKTTSGSDGFNNVYTFEDLPEDPFAWNINNNMNIINQEGLFLINLSPTIPLDSIFAHQMQLCRNSDRFPTLRDMPKERFDAIISRENSKFRCFDIHVGLKPYIAKKLRALEPPIDKNHLFPNLYTMAEDITNGFLARDPVKK